MHNITVPTADGKMTGICLKSSDNRKSQMTGQNNALGGEVFCTLQSDNEYHNAKRKSDRFRTKGIVALTSLEKPVVSNIYDIAPGGLSFLHVNETDVSSSEFKMDIIIFDSLTDFEYFISQVKGRVVCKELVSDPENNAPVWRYNVEFLYLDSLRQSKLQTLCNLEQATNVWFLDERLPKISYDL